MEGITGFDQQVRTGLVRLELCGGQLTEAGRPRLNVGGVTSVAGRGAFVEGLGRFDHVRRVIDGKVQKIAGLPDSSGSFMPALNLAGDLAFTQTLYVQRSPGDDGVRTALNVVRSGGDRVDRWFSSAADLTNPQWDPDGSVTVWVVIEPRTDRAQLTRFGPDGSATKLGLPQPGFDLLRLSAGGYATASRGDGVDLMTVLDDQGKPRGSRSNARPIWSGRGELWVTEEDGTIDVLHEITLEVKRSMPSPTARRLVQLVPAIPVPAE